jgi:lactate dehydrogenase-like 2-hydroxyacid dehydrogenase
MPKKAKVVLTDYVWDSLEVEERTLEGLATLVALQTKTAEVIITPHAAWYSEPAMVGLQSGAPAAVRRVLSGQWPVNVVNKAVKGKTRAGP